MPLIDLNGLGHFKDRENAMIAAEYSASKTYKVGQHAYYKGTLYSCKTAITTAEAWNAAHWETVPLADEVTSQSEKIADPYESVITSGLVERPNGINLFDRYSPDIVLHKWFDTNGTIDNDANMGIAYIEVPTDSDISYSLLADYSFFGQNKVYRIPLFRADTHAYVGTKWGTYDQDSSIVTITDLYGSTALTRCCIGYTFRINNISTSFVCEGAKTSVPDFSYNLNKRISIPQITNIKGKSAAFLGDSVCAGKTVPSTDTDYYGWGYGGRVATANDMSWHNFGINGATIINMSGRSCIQDELTECITNRPYADYIILEGGVNDADLIDGETYTVGTYDPTDYTSTYDTTSFCGSLETMLRTAINAYPLKKIGYIIPMKMGVSDATMLTRRELFDKAKDICNKWGVPVLDLWNDCIMNSRLECYYDSSMTDSQNISAGKAYVDGNHPTDDGYDIISPIVERWMKELR